MPVVNTVGIAMPDDFPTNAYNSVHDRLREYRNRNPDDPAWLEYAAGWNAVASRFKTMATADEEFAQQIIAEQVRQGSGKGSLSHDEMQLQEEYLYSFVLNGYSTIESFCYATFALGALLRPTKFPMSTDAHLQAINPALSQQKYASEFPGSSVSLILTSLVPRGADLAYQNWGKMRNVLVHRIAPRRSHYAHVHEGPGPDPMIDRPTEWGNIVLDERTTKDRRAWLAATLTRCIDAARSFSDEHFG
jgi:hypothetical protein